MSSSAQSQLNANVLDCFFKYRCILKDGNAHYGQNPETQLMAFWFL